MRVMVIVKATKDSEAGAPLSAEGLRASSHGVRVRFGGGKSTVIDGPDTASKELIAGFLLWQVTSIENLTPQLRAQEAQHRARLAAKT